MSNFRVIFLIIILAFALFFIKDTADRGTGQLITSPKAEKGLTAQKIEKGVGEKMTYDVRLGAISLGRSVFTHLPSVEVNGRVLSVMAFETNLARFKDTEVIYADPQTMLPVKVERNILKWFTREKITESYDQESFSVTIKKHGSSRPIVIKKDSPIHNAVLLPQYIRSFQELLDVEEAIIANLPNRRYEIRIVSTEEIKVPAGTFKTYHFKSSPSHIDIWISADERRIPVKIKSNNLAFGYLMVLQEYTAGN